MAVSYEQVAAAAAQLFERGESVTVYSVRSALGRGSYSTITPLLRRWREQERERARERLEVPEAVAEAGLSLVRQLWEAGLTAGRAEASAEIEAMRAETAQERQAAEAIAAESVELRERVAKLEQQLEAERTAAAEREREMMRLSGELVAARDGKAGALAELTRTREDYQRLQEQLAKLINRLSAEVPERTVKPKARPAVKKQF